jgi:hypothetical protein
MNKRFFQKYFVKKCVYAIGSIDANEYNSSEVTAS